MSDSQEHPPAPEPAPAAPPTAPPGPPRRPRVRRAPIAERRGWERSSLIPAILLGLLLAAGAGWLVRAPLLRALARREGELAGWAAGRLLDMRDPGAFDVYVLHLGRDAEREGFASLLYELAGRSSLPPGEELEAEPPPEEPEVQAAHRAVLLGALDGPTPPVRRGGLYALLMLKTRPWTRDEELLLRVAARLEDPDVVMRRWAGLVLAAGAPPPGALPALVRATLPPEDDPRVRAFAVRALTQASEGQGVDVRQALLQALRDPAQEVREEAALALLAREQEVPLAELSALLQGSDPRRKPEVLRALARSRSAEATGLLVAGLDESDPEARLAAVTTLAGRAGSDVLAALERALRDEAGRVRLAAAVALRERADGAAAVPALFTALERALGREGSGWNELLELHRALSTHAAGSPPIEAPASSSAEAWRATVEAWRARLAGGEGR